LLKRRAGNYSNLAFSADGKFLAVMVWNVGPTSVIVYDIVSGEEIHFLPNITGFDWSPTGHELALVSDKGLFLLAEPGEAGSTLEQLANPSCFSVEWNPGY
jgi:WD40 repeat protein